MEFPVESPVEFVSPQAAKTYEVIEAIKEEIGEDEQGRVAMQRRLKDGKLVSLPSLPALTFSIDLVAQKYGGGRYYVRFYKGRTFIDDADFEIDEAIKPASEVPLSAAAPAPTLSGYDPMVVGKLAGLEIVVASQTNMVNALIAAFVGKKGEAGSEQSPLDVGLKIAEVIRGATPAPRDGLSVKDMAETFREGLKLGSEVSNPDGGGFQSVVTAFLPPVTRVLEAALAKEGKTLPGRAREPVPLAPSPPEAPPVNLPPAVAWLLHLRPFMNEIYLWAQKGWDAEAYVVSMMARMPDNVLDEIEHAAQDPNFVVNAIAALPPAFKAYEAWVTKAIATLQVEVTRPEEREEDDADDEAETPGGQ